MTESYWSRALNRRASRRRVVLAGGLAALGSAFLTACGGDDEPDDAPASGSPGPSSSSDDLGSAGGVRGVGSAPSGGTGAPAFNSALLAIPEDSSAAARRGGTYRHYLSSDIANFDPHVLSFSNSYQVLLNYNRLMRVRPGRFERGAGTVEGDLVAEWELSPDNLTLTLKLRPNAGMPDVPPVDGRKLDAEDVVYSWERWKAIGTGRSSLANEANPSAPILRLEAADSTTIVVTLQQPVASILSSLASQASGSFFVLPVEAESRDSAMFPIGGGPYFRSEHEPGRRVAFMRNQNYYEANLLYPDAIDMPVIADSATGLTQLKKGELHHYPVAAQDVIATKLEVPALNLYRSDVRDITVDQFFGFQPGEGTPFRDVRLRQAWSMMLDRDLYLDMLSNRAQFEAEGVPVETAWNSASLSTQYKGWWLDPKGTTFGENARYYVRNVAEARALAEAAGFPDGLRVQAHMIAGAEYGLAYHRNTEALQGMAGDPAGPFRLDIRTHDYATDWIETIRDSRGYFDGVAYRMTPLPSDPGEQLYALYNTDGALYYGFDSEGAGTPPREPFTGDPTAQELTNAMRTEFQHDARVGLAHQLQQYLAQQQYFITRLGSATGFELAWPYVKNWLVYRTNDHARRVSSYWLDPSLPPGK